MINNVKNEIAQDYSFGQICEMASKEAITSIVDVENQRFLAPESMVQEIQKACLESKQEVPNTIGQVAKVIYHSLAKGYQETAEEIEKMTGKRYECIHVVGGGCMASYLNQLSANICKKTVYAGPVEATAIGNVASQMISNQELKNLQEARMCIYHSFNIKEYKGE